MILSINKYREFKNKIAAIYWNRSWEKEEKHLLYIMSKRKTRPNKGIYDSIAQYKAQIYGVSKWDSFFLHTLAVFAFVYIFFKSIIKRIRPSEKKDAAYFSKVVAFPKAILEGKEIVFIGNDDFKLKAKDILFLCQIFWISNFNWILLSSLTFRIARIRYAIETYGIREVWTDMEYSCTCGGVYDYCIQNDIILNNFMHGEKVLTIRDSFTRFHRFYVWDNHYKEIFEKLFCKAEIIVANPWVLENPKKGNTISKKICYFRNGIESESEIKIIENSLRTLKNNGYEVYIRKHPRQLNKYQLSSDFIELVEFSKVEDLYVFDYIVSQFSTILFQCYCNNQNIVLDDVSNPERKKELCDRNYIFLNQKINTITLSNFCTNL